MVNTKKIVIDSSVAVKWVNQFNEKYLSQANQILIDAQKENTVLIMPELAKYEVGNALINKSKSLKEAIKSLLAYYQIPIQFITLNSRGAQETVKIAFENKMTFYDASFIKVAIDQNANLITDNPKHQKKYLLPLTPTPGVHLYSHLGYSAT